VLSDTNTDNYRLYNWKRTSFVVSSFATLEYFVKRQKAVNIHIFLNTGLHREGFDTHELTELISQLKNAPHITLEGVMSHLARADEIDMTPTDEQINRFKAMHQILVAE
jgi:alanine racemase